MKLRSINRKNASIHKILLVPEISLYRAFRLPRLFRKAGWKVDLLCLTGSRLAHSRYISKSLQEISWETLYLRLEGILRDANRPWDAVIVSDEKIARRLLDTGDAELLESWQPSALDSQRREFLVSKFGLASLFKNAELKIPPCRICRNKLEIIKFGDDVGWPIILKPPHESGGVGVRKVHEPAELTTLGEFSQSPFVVQKFIHGRLGVVDMLCSDGRALAQVPQLF